MADTKQTDKPVHEPSFPANVQESSGNVPAVKKKPMTVDELRAKIEAARESSEENSDEVERRIIERMLSATTLEELLAPSEVLKWSDYLEKTVEVFAVHFNESDFDDNASLYAVVDAELDGRRVVLSHGGRTVMQQLMIMDHQEMFPARIKLQQSPRPTKNGFKPFNLAMGDKPEEPFQ